MSCLLNFSDHTQAHSQMKNMGHEFSNKRYLELINTLVYRICCNRFFLILKVNKGPRTFLYYRGEKKEKKFWLSETLPDWIIFFVYGVLNVSSALTVLVSGKWCTDTIESLKVLLMTLDVRLLAQRQVWYNLTVTLNGSNKWLRDWCHLFVQNQFFSSIWL